MGADILFLKKPAWAPRWVARLRRVLGCHDAIGHADHVRSAVSEVFPAVEWRKARTALESSGAGRHRVPWFGSGPPDFQIVAGPAEEVTMLFASGIGSKEVRIIEDRLGLVATNMYGQGLLDFIFG